MTSENQDAQLGRRVGDLEREIAVLRQRVTELERATGSAASIQPLAVPAMDIAPLDFFSPGPDVASPVAPPVVAPSALVSVPPAIPAAHSDVPPPLPVAPPPLSAVQGSAPSIPAPPPLPPPPRFTAPVMEPEGPSPLRLFLERLQLWPPSGEQNREASLGTWWATRLGTLLLVIGVVFLGVYVSRNTPPWVRFVELLGVSVGLSGFGLWLERKLERFGAVVFGGGLALLYFCAFGAFAVEAMKVVANPVAAAGWQLAAVLVMAGAAVWRRSSMVATMAVAFGFVTALFSREGGLPAFALGSVLLLGVVAIVFHRWWRWEAPAFVAMPATYVVGALLLQDMWRAGVPPSRAWVWLFLVGALGLNFLRDWRTARAPATSVSSAEKAFQGINSSLAVAVGVSAALIMYRAHLAEFYFGAAVVLGVLAWLRRTQVEGDAIGAVFLAKSAGALTLGVIETVEGRTTAIALLVQAWVMLFAAWRMKSQVLSVGTCAVAGVAGWFFVAELGGSVPLGSLAASGSAVFVLGLSLLATEIAQRLFVQDGREVQRLVELVGNVAAGVLALHAADNWLPPIWKPAMLSGLAAMFGGAAVGRRRFGPAFAAIFPLVAANVALWRAAIGSTGGAALWWNALAVLLPMIAAGVWLSSAQSIGSLRALGDRQRVAAAALWAAALLGLGLVFFNAWPGAWALLAMTALALMIAAAAPRWSDRHLVTIATWAAALGVGLWWLNEARVTPSGALIGAGLLLWALVVGAEAWPRLRAAIRGERTAAWLQALQVVAATIVSLRALIWFAHGPWQPFALALAAIAVGALVLRPGVDRALESSWIFSAFVWLALDRVWVEVSSLQQPVLAVTGLLVWLPVVAVARSTRIREVWLSGNTWWRAAEPVQNVIAVLISARIAAMGFAGAGELWALLSASALALATARVCRSLVPQVAALALAGWAALQTFLLVGARGAEGWGSGLLAALAVVALLAALPVVLERVEPRLERSLRHGVAKLLVVAAGLLGFYAMAAQHGGLTPYITVGWGLLACALFLVGLASRSRVHRLVGLVGLGLCVGRVFLVDLNSTMHRIIAFVVLGVVLLAVGFSYQKFRHLIGDDAKDEGKPEAVKP